MKQKQKDKEKKKKELQDKGKGAAELKESLRRNKKEAEDFDRATPTELKALKPG